MTKLILATMCVGILAGCTSSTMPAPNDPSTAIHEEPVMASTSDTKPSVAAAPQHKMDLATSATASK